MAFLRQTSKVIARARNGAGDEYLLLLLGLSLLLGLLPGLLLSTL